MIFSYYSPSKFEIPRAFRKKTTIFGMGKDSAQKLAALINKTPRSEVSIVFGSAGALKENLRVGEIFLIHAVGENFIPLSKHFKMPKASLTSSLKVLKSRDEKAAIGNFDLVDCEMTYLWEALSKDSQNRVLFVRGVIDRLDQNLDFLTDRGVKVSALFRPQVLGRFFHFILDWRVYLHSLQDFLEFLEADLSRFHKIEDVLDPNKTE